MSEARENYRSNPAGELADQIRATVRAVQDAETKGAEDAVRRCMDRGDAIDHLEIQEVEISFQRMVRVTRVKGAEGQTFASSTLTVNWPKDSFDVTVFVAPCP